MAGCICTYVCMCKQYNLYLLQSNLADPKNWALRKEDILNSTANMTSEKVGDGGFAPFGFHGMYGS